MGTSSVSTHCVDHFARELVVAYKISNTVYQSGHAMHTRFSRTDGDAQRMVPMGVR